MSSSTAIEGVRIVEEGADRRAEIYASIDPPSTQTFRKTNHQKFGRIAVAAVGGALAFGGPFIEDELRRRTSWYTPNALSFLGIDRMYGFVLIFNLVLPSLLTQLYIAFGVVGQGRKRYGYKLPVMFAAVDMHVEDVMSGGTILSGGSPDLAQRKLEVATAYSCHQRAHYNALETFPMFLALSAAGGIRYPLVTALHGLMWMVARVIWTSGYVSGTPIMRYANPFSLYIWTAFLGVIVNSIGLAIGVLSQ